MYEKSEEVKKIFLLLFLMSCFKSNVSEISHFRNTLFNNVFLSHKIEIDQNFVNTQQVIDRPFNTWQSIITFEGSSDNKIIKYCLNLKISPSEGGTSKLSLNQISSNSNCNESYGEGLVSLDRLSKVSFFLFNEDKTIFSGKMSAYTLTIKFSRNSKDEIIKIALSNADLNNLKGPKNDISYTRYSTFSVPGKNMGLKLSRVSNKASYDFKKWVGEFTDNYQDRTSKICHQFAKNCIEITANICNDCKYGFYEVLDYNCPQGRTKYCGKSNCGQRGMPACLSGMERLKKESVEVCYENSPYGICQQGLNTFCDENHILICL